MAEKKYMFTTFHDKGPLKGKQKKYRKDEHELTKDEMNILYEDFARHWDFIPLECKNRFMKWLRQSLQERQDKIDEARQNKLT